MKNILIVGPPRSGKTILASMIVKEIPCYSVINTDVIREGIYDGFFKLMNKKERKAIVKKAFPQIINKMLNQYQRYYNPTLYYVIEGDLLSIKDALKLYQQYEVELVCVGVPKMKPHDLFVRIRTYASKYGCWTDKYSDIDLLEKCGKFIKQSQKEEKIAKENNLIYLDTSSSIDCFSEYVTKIKN